MQEPLRLVKHVFIRYPLGTCLEHRAGAPGPPPMDLMELNYSAWCFARYLALIDCKGIQSRVARAGGSFVKTMAMELENKEFAFDARTLTGNIID